MMESQSSSQEESSKQRQDDELLSITAIFPNEVKDLRESRAWKNWKPLELLITLSPNSISGNEEITSQADLYVKCSENYPNDIPFIDIQNTKGISDKDILDLKAELRKVAECNLGREMLLELIVSTRNYLTEHKKPHYKSFYEEMMHNKLQQEKAIAEKEEREKEAQKLAEEKAREAIEVERNRKLEALKLANRKRRTFECSVASTSNSKDEFIRPRSHSEPSCKEICTGTVRTTLKFSGKKELSVFCGTCLNHNKRGCVVYYGMDTSSGNAVTVIKWTLQWAASQKLRAEELEAIRSEQDGYMKQLSCIEQEFKTLRQLKHNNIVSYLGMNCVQEKNKITIFILQEYVSGCPLSLMSKGIPVSMQQLQVYTCGILQAIQYLHENSVVHRNIRDTSIFVCNDGQVKVSDYSLDKKIYDMYRSLTNEPELDDYPLTIGKGGKKSDIYRLGIVLLSLSTGYLSKEVPPKVPQSLNPSFKDFLSKCLVHDEQERWSADQLLSHQFVAFSSVPSVLLKGLDVQNGEKKDTGLPPTVFSEACSYSSRLLSEFDILKCLGKGGFGYVLKVKNKLDSRVYALKRIPLNPSNKQLDRKIKREVKVLSRLNHENIVRYYNSWIEESLEEDGTKSKSQFSDNLSSPFVTEVGQSAVSSSVQWEMHNTKEDVYSTDEEDCEDYDTSSLYRPVYCSSSSIVFEGGDENLNHDTNSATKVSNVGNEKERLAPKPKVQRFMYIQMEFCEKSTLRIAIDKGLHKDAKLVWRLFREIVEGLHHIHQQGVIHRDLKPVNIFLDSNDHVKIGDFGLATDVISKSIAFDFVSSGDVHPTDHMHLSSSDIAEEGFCTGNVGTALYVAPEIATVKAKLSYNQKVDLYSLGIIFFEMCYPPPVTAMERVKLIMNIRQPDIVLPSDYRQHLCCEMICILKWLLQHDVSKRPTSAELISSDYIPPLMIEETELHNILRNTVSNSQSRSYKYMMNCLFSQENSTATDVTYDDGYKGLSVRSKPTQVFSDVVDTLNKILRMHGAVNYSVPTLMPKSNVYNNDTCVYVIDHGGGIVNLPHNLRVPFARYIARREISHLKRFTLEKVYREHKVYGCHPQEQYEYAFDVVTPTSCSFLPDAEVLSIVFEIISEFPSLERRNYYICLNHVSLLKAILKYCGVDETEEVMVCDILGSETNRNTTKLQLQHRLQECKLSEKIIIKLLQFFDVTDSIHKLKALLQPVFQTKGEVSALAKKGFKELKNLITSCESFGVKLPIFIWLTLAHEIQLYSGVVFQFVCHLKMQKKKAILNILAAGGRYDELISSFSKCKALSDGMKGPSVSAVGASIAVESIVAAELDSSEHGTVDFMVYADPDMAHEKCTLLREIWSQGFSATTFYDKQMSLNDVVDHCRNNGIAHLLIISRTEQGIIKVRSFEKEKMTERKLCHSDLKDYLSKFGTSSKADYFQPMKTEYQRSSSLHSVASPMMNVRFLPQDKTHTNRKRETNIRSHVMSVLQPAVNRIWEIIAVDLKMTVVGSIVSLCDINGSEESIRQTFSDIAEMYSKYKKYLLQISDEVCDVKSKKNSAAILYSMPDNNFRVIL